MALLLEIRPLDPTEGGITSVMTVGRFTVRKTSALPSHDDFSLHSLAGNYRHTYKNPAFESDFHSTNGSPGVHSWKDTTHSGVSPDHLTSSDSGINICVISDEAASVDGKSLDSGVYDEEARGDLPSKPGGDSEKSSQDKEESLFSICVQVFIPFLIAGLGTCGAGLVLDIVESWEVFRVISEIFILVPTLLGLKGNLEMTLASRVSTQANLGKLPSFKEQWMMFWGNMALVQCQATVLGFLSACFATVMAIVKSGFNLRNALLLSASSLFTASMASLLLGAITLGVVVVAHKFHINPDNVATPIAASLGDVTTLGILAGISKYLYDAGTNVVPSAVIIAVFLALVPVWAFLSYKNDLVRQVLYTGWTPVILAVVITSAGGYVLEFSITKFPGLAVFQPVINGVAGNLVAVQASRISTYFHRSCQPGSKPEDGSSLCISPWAAYFGKSTHSRTARVLMAMVIPGHLLFGYGITLVKGGETVLTPTFLPIYLGAAFIQVALLLYIAHCMIQIMWRYKIDPDNSSIPLLTALGDLSGMIFLTIAFMIHYSL